MVDAVKALKVYRRTTGVLDELTGEVERLRAQVQALEEEAARKEEADSRRGVPCPACGHGMSWVVGL